MFQARSYRYSVILSSSESVRTVLLAVLIASWFGMPKEFVSAHPFAPDSQDQDAQWGDIGLQTAWVRQSAADGMRSQLGTITPYLTAIAPRQVYEVYAPDLVGWYTPESLDRYGAVLGEAGARRQADILMRTLQAQGMKAEVRPRSIYRMLIYLQTDSGILQCLDAETGVIQNNIPLGITRSVSDGIGANESKIAAIHGSNVFLINLMDEKVEAQFPLPGIPEGGLLLTEDRLLVPLHRSRMAVYALGIDRPLPRMRSYGGAFIATPIQVGNRIVSLTRAGQLYLEDRDTGRGVARVEMRSRVAPGLAVNRRGMVFAASQDGFIFAIDPQAGDVVWQKMVDGSLRQAPLAVENQILACSVEGRLFCLNVETSETMWILEGVKGLVGVNEKHVLVESPDRQLLAIDRTTGIPMGRAPLATWRPLFTNPISDRIFLANASGQVRALRPTGQPWPTYYIDPPKPRSAEPLAVEESKPSSSESAVEEPEDEPEVDQPKASQEAPADEEGNPFGESNPVGDGENPFDG